MYSNEYDEETITQNKKNKITKKLSDYLDEIIDKSKSFEDQIKSIKKSKKFRWLLLSQRFWW